MIASFVCSACGARYAEGGFCAHDGTQVSAADDVLLGTELGRYRIARLLGAGGMSRVYLGVNPEIGSRVAIKVLGDACASNPELLERFFAEARAVNLIRHEHIISVLDLARMPDGRPYIVMEFIAGQTLGDLVRGEAAATRPLGGIVRVMLEVLSALAAAHAIGIVHRDLKPDNILVTAEGHAKVLDFGIAKLAPGLGDHHSPRTATGALLGTPAYMAPEQIAGAQNVDARSDIYAAGVVLFEAVIGHPPFQSLQLFELMRAHLEQPAPLARTLRPDLPESIERVIAIALAKDPAQRFQNAADMMRALEVCASGLPPAAWQSLSGRQIVQRPSLPQVPVAHAPTAHASVVTGGGANATAHTRRRSPLVIVALALAVVAIAVLVLVLVTRGGSDRAIEVASSAGVPKADADVPKADVPKTDVPKADADVPKADVPNPADPKPAGSKVGGRKKPDVQKPDGQAPDAKANAGSGSADGARKVDAQAPPDLGPGVKIEGNVTFHQTNAKSLTVAADYDPRHFDPVAYIPRALAMARQLLPDAAFTEFEMYENVWPNGAVDLTQGSDHDSYFEFRSPSRSKRPPNIPDNKEVDLACRVVVEVHAKTVEATVRTMNCNAPIRSAPRCTIAHIWDLAKKEGARSGNVVATVGFLHDGTWFFDLDGVRSFKDCN